MSSKMFLGTLRSRIAISLEITTLEGQRDTASWNSTPKSPIPLAYPPPWLAILFLRDRNTVIRETDGKELDGSNLNVMVAIT